MKIYFDLDGVLANFDKGVVDILNLDYMSQEESNSSYHDELYKRMKKVDHFYYQLEPIEEMVDFFNMIYEKYGEDVEILTGIPRDFRGIKNAKEDKIKWVKKYLNDTVKINVVYRVDKVKFVTHKNDILIDDYIDNIKKWEKHGGSGIYHKTRKETEKELNRLINEIKEC